MHRLNSVAAIIWQLCDGTRDRPAISAEIAAIFGKSPSDVAGDVDEILARFIDAGLVHSSSALPEIDLLLRCVQTAIGNERPGGIRTQLSNNIDWIFIEQTAVQHGVLPLVYRGLREIQQNDVPSDVLERLEHSFSVNAERNRFLFQEPCAAGPLRRMTPGRAMLDPRSLALHGDVALRQIGDLDLSSPRSSRVAKKVPRPTAVASATERGQRRRIRRPVWLRRDHQWARTEVESSRSTLSSSGRTSNACHWVRLAYSSHHRGISFGS